MAAIDEVYGTEVTPEAEALLHQQFTDSETRATERAAEAVAIGMPLLATQDTVAVRNKKVIAWCQQRNLTPLTDADRVVWEKWLPTGYITPKFGDEPTWGDRSVVEGGVTWGSYAYYEGVPSHIRKLIASAMPLFTRLEIRTPEKQAVEVMDPALFGHIEHANGDRDIVLLARWGESDANWLSFDDVKDIVHTRTSGVRKYLEHHERLQWAAVGTIVAFMLCIFLVGLSVEMGLHKIDVLTAAAGMMLAPTAVYWLEKGLFQLKRQRFEKNNPHLKGMV